MASESYPKREPYFSHRFLRMLHKTCAVQQIGHESHTLLTIIALTEDAKRYSGPVTYYNTQLMHICGFAKWDRLNRARDKAIGAGFLHYENHGQRSPGVYWVVVPDDIEMPPDTPIDEGDSAGFVPSRGYKQGYKDGYNALLDELIPPEVYTDLGCKPGDKAGVIEGIKRGQLRVQSGYERGDPSIPIPKPIPKPNSNAACAACTEQSATDSMPSPPPPEASTEYTFPTKGKNGREWTLSLAKLEEYRKSYPDLDVDKEMRKALQWCRDNPAKQKTAGRGIAAFLTGWLNRAQNSDGASRNGKTKSPQKIFQIGDS